MKIAEVNLNEESTTVFPKINRQQYKQDNAVKTNLDLNGSESPYKTQNLGGNDLRRSASETSFTK